MWARVGLAAEGPPFLNESDKVSYRPIRTSAALSPGMVDYRAQTPGPDLAGHVTEFWQCRVEPPHAYAPIQVFPTGSVTLRFDITAARVDPHVYGPSLWAHNLAAYFAGVTSFGVALHVGAARGLLGIDVDEIRDRRIAQRFLWPSAIPELCERLHRATDFGARVGIVSTFLRSRIRGTRSSAFPGLLLQVGTGREVASVARLAGMSERTFYRHCTRETGLGPKELARVLRVQRAMRQLCRDRSPNLSRTALDASFSDQAHLCREFQRTLGLSPRTFQRAAGGFGELLARDLDSQLRRPVVRADPPDDWSWREMEDRMHRIAALDHSPAEQLGLLRKYRVTGASFSLWKARYETRAERILQL